MTEKQNNHPLNPNIPEDQRTEEEKGRTIVKKIMITPWN